MMTGRSEKGFERRLLEREAACYNKTNRKYRFLKNNYFRKATILERRENFGRAKTPWNGEYDGFV